ncbi:MAG TPA: FAD-dependent 5-carboxymethylaminomethyl-2-thiouridine(34) oxidoreductase MnmC [Ideonella sp.]|uniref:FAD-dependent 5-carboxymethylaminomethyl-2-thiouridine(34) oxidoreductase MnmC n=1 Tax=Ideonella sp. TaxID=1929293 RepID=UPI002E37DF15|nr:FAD-dependent 5-carboxymethylaminomethyl-2-thiouridine(34) oxidoreductase MnmC [Ideonella sp.]HEX5684307.1 FAD-dependent 5-carboxymethylaminomethyl-2-thiouridine(34) oxidoreductase MnmC [Ideonella sp.]
MKTEPIVPARIEFRDGVPFAPEFGDVYHPRVGAFAQARDVFLAGNGLPARWRGRERFVVLETGCGLGNNFLATWAAWRADAQRSRRLVFVSVEKHPPALDDMVRAHTASPEPALAAQLISAWPPATPGLHVLEFEDGQVTLLLALGDLALWLPELQAQVDAVFLDGFAPARNAPMWDAQALRALARLAAPGATAATWSAARSARDALTGAGFRVQRVPGFAGKFEMTLAQVVAHAAGRRRGPPPGRQPASRARDALVIGAGLAGASAARALARQGLRVTVLDQADQAASGASGNPGGLFHGVVHAHDGPHAQLLRAAALRAEQVYRPLIASGRVPGALQGLLRGAGSDPWSALQTVIEVQQVPATYAEALSRQAASAAAGCPLAGAAWRFAGAGWLRPAALVQSWLHEPGICLRTGARVVRLNPLPDGRWQALDEHATALGEADLVVVAAAHATPNLLAEHSDAGAWPWRRTRGQITVVRAAEAAALPRPIVPIASGGYLLALPDAWGGGLLCGATSHVQDDDQHVREADHRANLAQIAVLTGTEVDIPQPWFDADSEVLDGRVAWRLGCDDRLPVVGPVPLPAAACAGARRLEQARHVPRVQGLYVLAGLGSRGITWAPLLGEVLAAGITGAPLPLAGSLLDAIDPARFVARQRRQPPG